MFPKKINNVDWVDYFEEFHDGFDDKKDAFFIFEKNNYSHIY